MEAKFTYAWAIRDPFVVIQVAISPILVSVNVALPDDIALSPSVPSSTGVLSPPVLAYASLVLT